METEDLRRLYDQGHAEKMVGARRAATASAIQAYGGSVTARADGAAEMSDSELRGRGKFSSKRSSMAVVLAMLFLADCCELTIWLDCVCRQDHSMNQSISVLSTCAR